MSAPDGGGGGGSTIGGSAASYAIVSDAITQSIPEADRNAVRLGSQRAIFGRDQLENGIPFKSTTKVADLQIRRPEELLERAKSYGIKNPSDIAVIGCGTIPDSKVVMVPRIGGIEVKSTIPFGDDPLSTATVEAGFNGEPDSAVKYGYFQLTSQAREKINSGSISLNLVSATIMSAMSQSLEAAEKNGLSKAVTNAAGNGIGRFVSGPSDALQGYRLWPKFGFDADVGSMITERFLNAVNESTGKKFSDGLPPAAKVHLGRHGTLRVQHIIETKQGEEWWNKNGSGTVMTLDFSDKSSLGYRRYTEMLSWGKKMAARLDRQGRSAFEFWLWASEETGMPEFRNCEIALFPEQRVFCATGVGGGVKNDCGPGQTERSFPEGSQNLRDAVDSVSPDPEKVWDRSKGLAETPAPKQMDDIANEQTSHSGAPLTPEAEASYGSLVDEIGRQYEALTAAGLKARAWRGEGEPYGDPPGSTKPNSDKMRQEVAKTGEFSFFMTDKGFGTGDATPNHPMLRETKYKTADGEPMIANDLFRVVHDMVAHVRGGYSFSTNGEYNGMLTHASTLPEAAWPALFAETFGQNAVYEKTKNYAPQNAYASKVGPEIIRSELKKQSKSSRAAKAESDEPLGYQHIKSRPWLLKSLVEKRGFCANGPGGGVTNTCGKGVGINDSDQDFTGQILSGEKTIETRPSNSLKSFIGKTVGIVRTGKGKATLVGVMKIGEPKFYKTQEEFDADFDKHRVGKDSKHYIGPEGKYGYPLSEVKPTVPLPLDTKHYVARVIPTSVQLRELAIWFDLSGVEIRGDAPAPKKDKIKGSDVNDEGSAKNKSGDISLNESIVASLKSKAEEHNAAMRKAKKPSWTHVSLPALKAVYRRGAGAFSTSHRPGMTRDRWALARVNAFLTLARRGRPENAKYTTDNDLLHSSHPKHSTQARAFCPRGEGNGIDNSCGAKTMSAPDKDGGGGAMPSKVSPGSSQWGENEKEIGRGEDTVFFRPEEPMFDGADRLGVITIKDPDATKAALKSLGMSVADAIAASGVCLDSIGRLGISPPRVTISPNYGNESDPLGTRVALFHVWWSSAATQGDDNDDSPPSVVGGERSFYRSTDGSGFSIVAQTFHINLRYRGKGIALEMMENMINSGATEIVMREASRDDAGGNSRYALTGYSEWPKYGYDCPRSELRRAAQRRGREVPPEYSRARSLLDVYATPGGREWWKESGDSVPLRFDCTPGSRSMQVFDAYRTAARAKHDRRSQIEARPAEDASDCDFDPVLDKVWDEIEKAGKLPGKVATESRSADCGREDDGRFASGNKCGGSVDMPKEDPRGRMRYDNGVQTDAARKLYQMGSSEKRLKSLVDVMGGDPKSTRVDINPPSLNISVADKDGNKLFHVDLENGRARLYPAKDLTPAEAAKIKEAAGAAFGGRQSDTTIKVFGKAEDMKKWETENAAKLQKSEDKYKFSTLLPPHQRPKKWERSIDARHASLLAFAESRDCGQEKDGKFSKGNTCAGGIAADAAKGAATGAVFGAVSGLAKTFLPQGAASGAAAGAVAGAVKGIYDNQMRPTRVSARIERVGMTDKSVAALVKGLGGTSKSLASTNGRSGLTLTIRAKGGKVSHVVDVTDKKVLIYPVSGRKEMTDDQIAKIKTIASENAPKETTVVVKTNSLSYASRLAKKGFAVAAKEAGVLTATAIASAYAPAVPDFVLGVTDLVLDTHFTDSFYRKPDAKR